MASWMLEMGTWQAGCWRLEHDRLGVGCGFMVSWMLEMGTWQAG